MKLVSSYFTSDLNPIMIKHRLVFVFQINVKLRNRTLKKFLIELKGKLGQSSVNRLLEDPSRHYGS